MELYPYQKRVKALVQSNQSVILQAPTGAGKTRAALAPFIEAFFDFPAERFAKKCIYAVPMRVLANQFVHEYQGLAERYHRKHRRDLEVRIQTGEHADDRQLEGDLIFATIDQVLSSFLLSPYSLPRRLSNLNAGAIAASYLVFDEFHLFDPVSTLPTTLEMLRMLSGVTPFLLMTATFSGPMLSGLAKRLGAEVVPEDDAARREMQSLQSQHKTRRYHVEDGPLCAQAVLTRHKRRTLVVCNVVDRARRLYESLRDHPDRGEAQVLLLHSRFLPQDRQCIEKQICERFGRGDETKESCIAVATQAIEVGLDITCEALHTELAPANAVLQRAGRCAQYQGEEGDVYLYAQAFDVDDELLDLSEKAQPYQDQRDEIARTLTAFRERSGSALTFADEQEIISAVHGPRDRLMLEGVGATQELYRRKMNLVMDGQRSGDAGDLIRAVSSKQVVVHDDPQAVLEHPFAAEAFSLHPGSVMGLARRWLEKESDLTLDGWGVQALYDKGDEAESGRSVYCWVPIQEDNVRDIIGAPIVLVHPALAGYEPDLGFVPDRGTGYRAHLAKLEAGEPSRGGYLYKLERYDDHVRRVLGAFRDAVWPELARAAMCLEHAFAWPEGTVARAAHLVVLLHDVGKLNKQWQHWVSRYQAAIGQPVDKGFYAHTDSDPSDPLHSAVQTKMGRKPPHAVEGAVAAAPLLDAAVEGCEAVFAAAFTAIARHHGAFTHEFQRYALVAGADRSVGETLSWLPDELRTELDAAMLITQDDPTREPIQDYLVNPAHDDEFLTYILLARALRRADQLGTMAGSL